MKKWQESVKDEELDIDVDQELEQEKREKTARRARIMTVVDRIFGVLLVTGIVVGCACLGLEYVLVKGPSKSLREKFVMTMDETRRFAFISNIFLTEAEVAEIRTPRMLQLNTTSDSSLISLPTQDKPVLDDGTDAYGLKDDDGDGIIYQPVTGNGFVGHMIVILDPKRVFVSVTSKLDSVGDTIQQMCENNGAIGGINAGGFIDDSGAGLGGFPDGLTIIDGEIINWSVNGPFCGFDRDGIMHVGWFNAEQAQELDIVGGASFGPLLIVDGEPVDPSYLTSGVNPRTAIAQRADGAVIMLVIDGRQVHSIGATYQDVVDLLLDNGVVNACNMDGGSSTCMWYNGQLMNSVSGGAGMRPLPTAYLFK